VNRTPLNPSLKIAALLAALALAPASFAADTYSNGGDGLWTNASTWQGGLVPDTATYNAVLIGNATTGSANVTLNGNGNVTISYFRLGASATAGGTLNIVDATLTTTGVTSSNAPDIGRSGSSTGTLNIYAGGVWNSAGANLGFAQNTKGTVNVDGGEWIASASIFLGGNNPSYTNVTGILNVLNGGRFDQTSAVTQIGYHAGANGTLTVTSGGNVNLRAVDIGNLGKGLVSVTDGLLSIHSTTVSNIGNQSGSNGTLFISGASASVNQTAGSGSSPGLMVGNQSGSTGAIEVRDGGSLRVGLLKIGVEGEGSLVVDNAVLTTYYNNSTTNTDRQGVRVGVETGGVGNLTLNDATLTLTGALHVGVRGTGTANITGATSITGAISGSGCLTVGTETGGVGTVFIKDADASFQHLYSGVNGSGNIVITNSTVKTGRFWAGNGVLTSGDFATGGGDGRISVTGSTINATGTIHVGTSASGSSTGILYLTDSRLTAVTSADVWQTLNIANSGTGVSGTLIASNSTVRSGAASIATGNGRTGVLTLKNGSNMTTEGAANFLLGAASAGTASATLNLDATSRLTVGGTLQFRHGAAVNLALGANEAFQGIHAANLTVLTALTLTVDLSEWTKEFSGTLDITLIALDNAPTLTGVLSGTLEGTASAAAYINLTDAAPEFHWSGNNYVLTLTGLQAVPEPSATAALLGAMAFAALWLARRRKS
jgi:hypothetical protein